ncbi:alpha-ketoglutarate-dependent dioxygenase AlkB family protein [Streptomyces indiaensis]|uniref:Alpha-ketoglutarate-dependent dioxygenase AlkB n=1 Tax=Streptomyces indiaensis TaxID=284033 RepID=A0ABP5R8P0_9ACTN|nr:alpha-ketoglutarate-dependent dioxygenase AlkB [Streptomyces indiaensis]MCF1648275.1 alpha-ketoglutarate-dependent dioxygenase AlkB [Streptomyces indiaensis]
MDGELFPRARTQVAPGAVHLPGWLDAERQSALLDACRAWARPPAGLRTVRTPGGGTMTARQVCLGWHWYPYAYARTVADGDGAPVKPFPRWLGELGRRAVHDTLGGPPPDYDIALINFYDADARMGMHRDSDEKSDAPVVSLSLGDTCVFRFGNTATRTRPWTDVELRSGDLFVFGGPSRFAYHGVPRVHPDTAPPALGLTGRLNITLRVSGLHPPAADDPGGPAAPGGHTPPPSPRIMGDSPS